MEKKLLYIGLGILAVVLMFIGYHYARFQQATSRMKGLSADLERRIVEFEKKEYKRPPLFGPAVPGNAAEYYEEAYKKISKTNQSICRQITDHIDNPSRPLSSEAMAYYEQVKPVIEVISKGTHAENYKSLTNHRDGFF
ncbi:MAG: hypothetical protein V1701_04950 [Planctomycetota bacterium]